MLNRIALFKAVSVPNFTRLDPSRPEIAVLMHAMLRAREAVAARSWSASQEPTSEHWWADVLADPRARRRRVSRGLHTHRVKMVERAYYTLADEPRPIILVACNKCPWKAAFSRADLITDYGAEYGAGGRDLHQLAQQAMDAGLSLGPLFANADETRDGVLGDSLPRSALSRVTSGPAPKASEKARSGPTMID